MLAGTFQNRDRARTNAAFACERLGRYRMPFAWTAVYLMSVISQANTLDSEKDQSLSDGIGMCCICVAFALNALCH